MHLNGKYINHSLLFDLLKCLFFTRVAEALNSLNLPPDLDDNGKPVYAASPLPPGPAMTDKEILAKTFFDSHEYDRCAYVLRDAQSPTGLFLKLYSRYIVSVDNREYDLEF